MGILDLAGSIYQLTVLEKGSRYIIKEGSWFTENPQEACMGWAEDTVKLHQKRMDVGFRCVKPIFSREDIPSCQTENLSEKC
ncbi:MAG: hypothetical protein D3903_03030 [Candidatus Electrothrix sp. GM3_4]|nr:hypothetical protein [Candidatus Electrothrix sp. GM3_4]